MNNREYIGKRIAEIRQAKGLSIRQLAEASGVSFANIYKIENGKYNVSIDILGKICEALGSEIRIQPVNGWCASHSDFETDNVLEINLDNPYEAIEVLRNLVKRE